MSHGESGNGESIIQVVSPEEAAEVLKEGSATLGDGEQLFRFELPVTLKADVRRQKRKVIWSSMVCGCFAIVLTWASIPSRDLPLVAGAIFFWLLVALSLLVLFSPARVVALELNKEGFRLIYTRKEKPLIPWRHVERVVMIRPAGLNLITYQYTKQGPCSRSRKWAGLVLPISQFVDISVEAVAMIMELCRQHAVSEDEPSGPTPFS